MDVTYTVRGGVVDRSGVVVAGVTVELAASPEAETLVGTVTDGTGTFTLAYAPAAHDPVRSELGALPAPLPLPLRPPLSGVLRVRRGDSIVAVQPVGPIAPNGSANATVVFSDASLSTELNLHELGQSIAAAVGRVQDELARYGGGLGAFVVDDVEVSIPLRLRVDSLGQVRATVVAEAVAGDPGVANLQLRVKPVLGAPTPLPVTSEQPLASLGLPHAVVDRLAAERVFSVGDLLAVAARPAGVSALRQLGLSGDKLDTALGRAQVVALPMLPTAVATSVAKAGVDSPGAFVQADPARLARSLSARLKQQITEENVKQWQATVRGATAVPVPSKEAV